MKCSLLTLSTYLDTELDAQRRGEAEAHLVGCDRCTRGLQHLHEEVDRISALARVQVLDNSVQDLMEQVGLLEVDVPLPPRANATVDVLPDTSKPWLKGEVGAALPWKSVRPSRADKTPVMATPGETRDRAAISDNAGEGDLPDPSSPSGWHDTSDTEDLHQERGEQVPMNDSDLFEFEEVDLSSQPSTPRPTPTPPPAEKETAVATTPPPVIPPPATPPQPPMPGIAPSQFEQPPVPPPAVPPTWLGPQPGPRGGILARFRDAIAVRRAVARARDFDEDDTVEMISGTSAPSWRERPMPEAPMPPEAIAPAIPETPPPPMPPVMPKPEPPVLPTPAPITPPTPASITPPTPALDVDLDAPFEFPRSTPPDVPPVAAFPADAMRASEVEASPFASIRSEALRQERAQRVRPEPSPSLQSRVKAVMQSATSATNGRRPLMLVGAVALLLTVIGLSTGRSEEQLTNSPASQAKAAPAPVTHNTPQPTAASQATPKPTASAASTAVSLTNAHTLGSGSTGFQVSDVRYGQHPNDFRMVFDLASAGGSASGSPTVTVGFRDSTTMDVVFSSVVPAGSAGSLPNTTTVTSVTLLPRTSSGQTVYEYKLAHAVTVTQGYITSPLRLVIDLS